jgi:uncharacterized protein YukJ
MRALPFNLPGLNNDFNKPIDKYVLRPTKKRSCIPLASDGGRKIKG